MTIVSIDLGVVLDDYYGDAAVTLPVGAISGHAEMLLHVTEQALARSIAQVRPGGHVSDLGHAVQRHVEAHGYSVVREFVGHGIGTSLHEEPQVPNYGEPGQGPRLVEGMVLAIEPMVSMGKPAVKVLRGRVDRRHVRRQSGPRISSIRWRLPRMGPLVLSRPLQDAGASGDGAVMTWALGDSA